MRLHFLGAARTVTGSMHLVTTRAGTVLLDCGLFQGRRSEARERNSRLPKEALEADVLVLSHAHIDHSGSIPTLFKRGFRGTIYATPATRDLCAWMLRDAARIQQADAEYLNRQHADDPDWEPIEPLYDEDDAIRALEHFVGVPYRKTVPILPGVRVTFLDAGHILGSAEVRLDVDEGGRTTRLLFSGDIGRRGLPILRDPEIPSGGLDYLIMESTYGNRVHGDLAQMHDELERVVKDTAARGGKILIPAFAVGRTQEILHALKALARDERLPDIPVFIDSPLSVHITEVFKLHPECFDTEARRFLEENGDLFDFPRVRYVSSREESIRLNALRGPAIIVAASGMCEAGRILHHLKNNMDDPHNTILIVGFQAQHTLGRRLVERRPRVRIFGVERELHARVMVMNAFSAHADREDLIGFATTAGRDAARIFLVHGEPEQQEPLRTTLVERGLPVEIPDLGEVAELGPAHHHARA